VIDSDVDFLALQALGRHVVDRQLSPAAQVLERAGETIAGLQLRILFPASGGSDHALVVVDRRDHLHAAFHIAAGENDSVRAVLLTNLQHGLAHVLSKDTLDLHNPPLFVPAAADLTWVTTRPGRRAQRCESACRRAPRYKTARAGLECCAASADTTSCATAVR